jgi:CRP-like cAMP-binding protein
VADALTDLLGRVEIFRDLDRGELSEIANSMRQYTYEAGRSVVTEGEGAVGFFVIEEGTAKASVANEQVRTLGPGDYFGEIALLSGAPRTATVTAETDLTCWALTSWAFRPIVERNSSIAWKLIQRLAGLLSRRP